MISATSRSRLYELRRDRVSTLRAAELLEQKREVLLRETVARARLVAKLRRDVERAYHQSLKLLRIADVELGREGVLAAALAQPMMHKIESGQSTVMGVRLRELRAEAPPYRAIYGAAATTESLDNAGAAFAALLPRVIDLASQESSLSRLRIAVRKATKIVNALQKVILPRLTELIRLTVDSIAEEERDEAVRRKMRLAPA